MMKQLIRNRRGQAALLMGALALVLAGCLVLPGKFTSQLVVHKDGQFTFRYAGELVVAPLTDSSDDSAKAEFVAEDCYDDDSYEERDCSDEELAEQKSAWDEERLAQAQNDAQQKKEMSSLMGGLDPSDPAASREFAERLRNQAGWKRVEEIGKGVFDVEYEISSRATHPFSFPAIETMTMSNAILVITPRHDGTLRIDAPGFTPGGDNPVAGMAAGMGDLSNSKSRPQGVPDMDGTFVILTDGEILSNNTNAGPTSDGAMKKLVWQANARTRQAPMALIRMGN